MNVKVTMLDSL